VLVVMVESAVSYWHGGLPMKLLIVCVGVADWTVQIVTGVVVGALLLIATVIVIIVVYRKSGYVSILFI